MKICFFSNYLSPHQLPFCEEMYSLIGSDFAFVACEPYDSERLKMGWRQEKKRPYELRAFESGDSYRMASHLAETSDVMMFGSASLDFVKTRIKTKKTIIRYSERLFKNGFWSALTSLDLLRQIKFNLLTRSRNAYLFCASAFAPFDFSLALGQFREKLKWGYYPEVKRYEPEELLSKKSSDRHLEILWVGRLLRLKHPEFSVSLAERLRNENVSFHLTIIGSGEQEAAIKQDIADKDLGDKVEMLGSMSPEAVREYMEKSDIFIFSSDHREGWGAVLNESLNSGCVVFCCDEVGSSRYLIEDDQNGFLFSYGSQEAVAKQIGELAENVSERVRISRNAYNSIVNKWSAEIAAKRFLEWCKGISTGHAPQYDDGPMSPAVCVVPSKRWWKS